MASINEKSTEKVKRSEKDSSLPGKRSINYLCPVFTASLRARSCYSHCLVMLHRVSRGKLCRSSINAVGICRAMVRGSGAGEPLGRMLSLKGEH